jgi:hypothetical protein
MTDAERAWAVAVWRKSCHNAGMAARKPKLCRHFTATAAQARRDRLVFAREAKWLSDGQA